MSPTSYRAYQELTNPALKYYLQAYGKTGQFALGFAGPDSEVTKAHNLFVNFDSRPANDAGIYPSPRRLTRIHETLAYIQIAKERIRESLVMYFESALPFYGDVTNRYQFDEETENESWERDDVAIAQLARELADRFMAHEIKTAFFVPETKSPGGMVVHEVAAANFVTVGTN